ncbi:MAG: ferrochelatase [Gammaproteobacteria bacterium]|nr:ferrochelatase [Gammaproteobacteria bacterium]
MTTRGILLANLGSPDAPERDAVRRYLNEFLMDRHVIDAPWPVRRLVVSLILRRRPEASARAYRAIWRDEEPGSPLLHWSERLADALRQRVNVPVALGMRYGAPSLEDALKTLTAASVDEVLLMPLYPQHAGATRTTTIERARAGASGRKLLVLPSFHDRPEYLQAMRHLLSQELPRDADHLLFSYHGLPERQIRKADPTRGHCLRRPDCCEAASSAHAGCYRHQCLATTRSLAAGLTIPHSTSFQSRLGRLRWLTPYTEEHLGELAGAGVRHLAVASPSFVADNLETLEELGMKGEAAFRQAGGHRLTLIPCLNNRADWADALAKWAALPSEELDLT